MSYENLDSVPTQTAGSSGVIAEDWNTYVRDNFDTLKRGHVRVTNEAALSGLSVAVGTMAFAETEQSLWMYSTTGWVEVSKLTNTGAVSDAAAPFLAPVGALMPFAGTAGNLPSGWLLCDGTTVTSGAYPALYNILTSNGTAFPYGGSAGTTYTPNLVNKFVRGGTSVGTTGGSDTHTHVVPSLAGHDPSSGAPYILGPVQHGTAYSSAGQFATIGLAFPSINPNVQRVSTTSDAGSTLPAYVQLNYIIKA